MSTQVIGNEEYAALYSTSTLHAFGPVFPANDRMFLSASEVAELFLVWLTVNPAHFDDAQLDAKAAEFTAWLDQQDPNHSLEDLKEIANGKAQCSRCKEWTHDVSNDGLCGDCEAECDRDDAADHEYDFAGGR